MVAILANNMDMFLCSEHIVLFFLEYVMNKHYSWSRIYKTLSGISFFLKIHNLTSCLSFSTVRQTLKGYKQGNFSPDDRSPITPDVLTSVCMRTSSICFSIYEAILFNPVFTLAFFTALRISEIISINKKNPTGLLHRHLVLAEQKLKLFIHSSKTDQLGKGTWLSLSSCPLVLIGGSVIYSRSWITFD